MDKTIGSKSIKKVSNNGYIIRVGAVAFQLDNEGIKDLIYLLSEAAGLVIVEDEDMQKLVMAIDPNNTVPLKRTTNNNIFTGENISTEDLLELNKTLKHS